MTGSRLLGKWFEQKRARRGQLGEAFRHMWVRLKKEAPAKQVSLPMWAVWACPRFGDPHKCIDNLVPACLS